MSNKAAANALIEANTLKKKKNVNYDTESIRLCLTLKQFASVGDHKKIYAKNFMNDK